MDADRRRILEWLEVKAPTLAPVYDGAVRMILEPEFPGRVNFIAHAMREIMNRLPDIFAEDEESSGHTDYHKLTNAIADHWSPPTSSSDQVTISIRCADAIQDLVQRHQTIPGKTRAKAIRLFKKSISNEPPIYTIELWESTRKWAASKAHVGITNHELEDNELITKYFDNLDTLLRAILNRSYENMDELDEVLESS